MAPNDTLQNTDLENEVSLADLFWRLWDARGIIFVVPLILSGLAVLYVAISAVSQSQQVSYLVALRNIENQRYPNGTAFSPQDLLAPEVLTELGKRFRLPADTSLRDAISVAYDSPIADGIARSYQDRLSARNLSQAEIEALNENYLADLQAAMRISLRIRVRVTDLDIDVDTGRAIASALPDIWTEVYTTKFRIFEDRKIADLGITTNVQDLASTGSTLVANARIAAMRNGLTAMVEDNRLALLRNADGRGATEIELDLRHFTTIWFNPIKASFLGSGDTISTSYVGELRLDIADKRRQLEAYDSTLQELRDYLRQRQVEPQVPEQPLPPSTTIEFGQSILADIVALTQQTSYAEFVQETLHTRRDIMFEISNLTRELESIVNDNKPTVVSADFRNRAAVQLGTLTAEYSELVNRAQVTLRDRAGSLYSPLLGPITGGSLLSLRNLLIVGAAGLAGLIFTIIAVLLWSVVRTARSRKTA